MRRARLEAADRELERRNRELRQRRSHESTPPPVHADIELGAWIEAELSNATTMEEVRSLAMRIQPELERPQHSLLSLALYVIARRQWEDWQAGGCDGEPSELATIYRDLLERID